MARRKERTPVVLDTNVFVRSFKSRSKASPNKRVVRLWLLEKRLQLIVSLEVIAEYLEVFSNVLAMDTSSISDWRQRFQEDRRCTLVGLGRRFTESRDPDDNVMLATASAGRADYLLTNDQDLLELPVSFTRLLSFEILTPREFLSEMGL